MFHIHEALGTSFRHTGKTLYLEKLAIAVVVYYPVCGLIALLLDIVHAAYFTSPFQIASPLSAPVMKWMYAVGAVATLVAIIGYPRSRWLRLLLLVLLPVYVWPNLSLLALLPPTHFREGLVLVIVGLPCSLVGYLYYPRRAIWRHAVSIVMLLVMWLGLQLWLTQLSFNF